MSTILQKTSLGIFIVVFIGIIGYLIAERSTNGEKPSTAAGPALSQSDATKALPSDNRSPASTTQSPFTQNGGGRERMPQASPPSAQSMDSSIGRTLQLSLQAPNLAHLQTQIEKWACTADSCVASMRLPAGGQASRTKDTTVVETMMNSLKKEFTSQGVSVGLRLLEHQPNGMAIEFEFLPRADERGRFYTDTEIAKIRNETLMNYLNSLKRP
jgi:hypothetical protein